MFIKKTLRILRTIFLVLGASILLLFAASLIFSDRITALALDSINKQISTKLQTGAVKLSFLRGFPRASVDIKDVVVYSSGFYRKSDFPDFNTDILLTAERISIEFRLTDLLKKNYRIENISLSNGRLTLLTDSAGSVNYDFVAAEKEAADDSLTIDLNRVLVSNVTVDYINLHVNVEFNIMIGSARMRSRLSGDLIGLKAEGSTRVNNLGINDLYISKSFTSDFRLDLLSDRIRTFISSGSFSLDAYTFDLEGEIAANNKLDLRFKGASVDLAGIRSYLPPAFSDRLTGYDPSGTLNIEGTVKGEAGKTGIPDLDIKFSVNNGSVIYAGSEIAASGINLSGSFSYSGTGAGRIGILNISSAELKLGSEIYRASANIEGFSDPLLSLRIEGILNPSELRDFFNLSKISSASGSAAIVLELKGSPGKKNKYTLNDLLNLDFTSSITLNKLSLGVNNNKFLINNASGSISLSDTSYVEKLAFSYNEQSFIVTGTFYDLPSWISGYSSILKGKTDVYCAYLDPAKLFPASVDTVNSQAVARSFRLPDDFMLDTRVNCERFKYGEFTASAISGTVEIRPGLLDVKDLSLNSMDGLISGSGLLYSNADKSFTGKGSFKLESVNIEKAFYSFRNFGQDFIRSENLSGKLSGTLSVLIPFDSLLKPVTKSLTAEGNYVISGGELKNFEPVKALSKFIELSELENIRFERLDNDFFIRNNALYVPQMDVRSSAANITVSGKHDFDNHYEYHLKVLLSQLLSQKLKKSGTANAEFGAVQDDGLGRTSLLLKIEDRDDEVRVSYDAKAAGSEIKNDIKAERQNLKTMLNQEYGWFKNDTAVKQKTETRAEPRFRISWGEGDTIKQVQEQVPEKKVNPLRNIIKKR